VGVRGKTAGKLPPARRLSAFRVGYPESEMVHIGNPGLIATYQAFTCREGHHYAPKTGHADIIISAITALSAREDDYGIKFSKPYYCTTQSLIFKAGALKARIGNAIENKRIGVVSKTTSEDMIRKFPGKFNVKSYDDGVQMIADVAKGEVKFAMIDTPLAKGAELQSGREKLNFRELIDDEDFPRAIGPERRQEKYAVAVRSGEEKLIGAVNGIIEQMRTQTLQQFLQTAMSDFYQTKKDQSAPLDARADPSVCGSH
jgi:hypothetical protein